MTDAITITAADLRRIEDALIDLSARVHVWQGDVDCGLAPYPDGLREAKAEIEELRAFLRSLDPFHRAPAPAALALAAE